MQKQDIIYSYNDSGYTPCDIVYKNKTFTGHAYCLGVDKDFQSERVGCEIALRRAEIDMLKQIKYEQKLIYDTINHVYSTMNHSSKYNPDSYEAKSIQRELANALLDYVSFSEILKERKQALRTYIENKEGFYKKLRVKRAQNNN